jgi:flagellar operon protein
MTDPVQLDFNPSVGLPSQPACPARSGEGNFAQALEQAGEVRFSSHAQKRLQQRSITLSGEGMACLAEAIDKVEKRGGRESLVLMDDLAFIVNVPERVVVTALDVSSSREGVFTQVDSVVLADLQMGKKSYQEQIG